MLKSVNGKDDGDRRKAGETFPESENDVKGEKSPNTFSKCDPSSFDLRVGPNYAKNKCKKPSVGSLMEIVGVELRASFKNMYQLTNHSCIQSGKRIDNIGSKVDIPSAWTGLNTQCPKVPSLFIINVQIPSEFPTTIFREISDGPGWSLVLYFRMNQETADNLIKPTVAPPGVKLFSDYCSQAPEADLHGSSSSSPWKARFKATMRCQNIDEFGLPSFISAYNGKPVLIRHTGTLIRGNGYIEMDINVHRFASVPKKALQILMRSFDRMTINMGFCIESKEESEMPEILIGCVALNKPAVNNHPQWKEQIM